MMSFFNKDKEFVLKEVKSSVGVYYQPLGGYVDSILKLLPLLLSFK